MTKNEQLTLFLWLQGLFPRRVNYWLLIKGLVSSPHDLLDGKTTDPDLSIVRLSLHLTSITSIGWKNNPENDPLEEVYADRGPALQPKDLLNIAATNDLVGQINLSIVEGLTYIRHASPQFAAFSGIKEEERSQVAARVGHQSMVRGFLNVLDWAGDSLETTGWLTPGTDGPGLVDVNMAAPRRYFELVYGWNIFEKEELKPLAEWYDRFRKLLWWDALEERPDVHPAEFKFAIDKFEV